MIVRTIVRMMSEHLREQVFKTLKIFELSKNRPTLPPNRALSHNKEVSRSPNCIRDVDQVLWCICFEGYAEKGAALRIPGEHEATTLGVIVHLNSLTRPKRKAVL